MNDIPKLVFLSDMSDDELRRAIEVEIALWMCVLFPGQSVLAYSQGQTEADELIRRVSFLYDHHHHRPELPPLARDNVSMLEWSNKSRTLSLAATRKAGRSFTGSLVILDEWAADAGARCERLAADSGASALCAPAFRDVGIPQE